MRGCADSGEQIESEKEKAYRTNIALLKIDKASIQAVQDSLQKQVSIVIRRDSVQLAAQNVRIKALQAKLANQRPIVIEKIQADTAVLSYVNTLEEVVTELQVQNDTLKSQAQFQRKLNEDLIITEFQEDRVERQMFTEQARRIDELRKQAKKKERKSRLKTILIPVVAVLGFLVGGTL